MLLKSSILPIINALLLFGSSIFQQAVAQQASVKLFVPIGSGLRFRGVEADARSAKDRGWLSFMRLH